MKPKLSDLTLRERIGQTACARPAWATGKSMQWFKENPYGSTQCHGSFNLGMETIIDTTGKIRPGADQSKAFAQWTKEMDSNLKVPLLYAVDAEKGSGYTGCSETTCATGIGATHDVKCAEKIGECIAKELQDCGINWIFGPVYDNPSPFLAVELTRNFSDDPDLITKMGNAQSRGIQKAGSVATAKHFPGTDKEEYRDAHFCASVINQDYDEWWEKQGRIFQKAIDDGVYSIMIGHTAFPAVDDTEVTGGYIPATLSYKIIMELLKGKMGFKGVVVTDGIGMKNLTAIAPMQELYIMLLEAGNDIVLVSSFYDDYIDVVEKAVHEGRLSEERINDACQRVLDLKEKLGMFDEGYINPGSGLTDDILSETEKVNFEIAQKSITVVRDDNKIIPLNSKKTKKVKIVFSGHSDSVFEKMDILKDEFEKRGAQVSIQRRVDSAEDMVKIANEYDFILYVAHIAGHAPFGAGALVQEEAQGMMFVMTAGKEKSMAVSVSSPYIYYDYFTNAPSYINAYWNNRETLETLVSGLYGEVKFDGKSPVDLIPIRHR